MTCEQVQRQLVALMQEELADPEREPVEAHVEQCNSCRALRNDWAAMLAPADGGDPQPVTLVNMLLQQTILDGASDAHMVPGPEGGTVQYRVDGVLRDAMPLSGETYNAVVARLKIMAECDVAEKRLPQDGRINIRFKQKDYDLRLSTLPCLHGESAVLRIFPQDEPLPTWDRQGLSQEHQERLRDFMATPTGIVVFSGATGSGKTTTMYSAVQTLDHEALNIVTVEDPVDHRFAGLTQVHVDRKRGLTPAAWIAELLQCDPDVLVLGEVKDRETAEAVAEAALSGHLCVTQLHAADSLEALRRFAELCGDPARALPTIVGVVGQRLVRRVCEACSQEDSPSLADLARLGLPEGGAGLRRGAGCEQCRGTGYHGRSGLFEVLRPDEDLRRLVLECTDLERLRDHLLARGWRALLDDGRDKVLTGVTSVAEVLRVIGDLLPVSVAQTMS